MIKLETVNPKYPKDIIADVKLGNIHIVCMAQNGLTYLNVYAELYYKLEKQLVNTCVKETNSKLETGTLYPKANISILPKNVENRKLTKKELKESIKDVFKANELCIGAEIIYFTLERSYINKALALEIIKELIIEFKNESQIVKTIWIDK